MIESTKPATAADLLEMLGEIDPIALDKLLAIGASAAEVAEAAIAIEDEDAFGELHREPSSPRAAEVRAILEELVFEKTEDADDESEVART
ncbi:MAG TPA: hypothetical protein VMJ10_16720 [Kofleriaceae bacterium]|nr:hypothetical protein [Kofleriaceae bacterium]